MSITITKTISSFTVLHLYYFNAFQSLPNTYMIMKSNLIQIP